MSAKAVKALYAERIKARVVDLQTRPVHRCSGCRQLRPAEAAKDPALSAFLKVSRTLPRSSAASVIPPSIWWSPTANSMT